MACAVSTEAQFDLDVAWRLAPQVQVRPERFGALLYHFGTRQLSFLKSPALLAVVRGLATQPSARAACQAADVPAAQLPSYRRALGSLAAAQMICRQEAT
jgi:mycofactocin biosynthesis protein MftB